MWMVMTCCSNFDSLGDCDHKVERPRVPFQLSIEHSLKVKKSLLGEYCQDKSASLLTSLGFCQTQL